MESVMEMIETLGTQITLSTGLILLGIFFSILYNAYLMNTLVKNISGINNTLHKIINELKSSQLLNN